MYEITRKRKICFHMEDEAELRHKSFYNHPKLKELEGITQRAIKEHALLVYIQLIETQFWFDVEMIPLVAQQIVFLKGRRNKNSDTVEYVLPMDCNSTFKTNELNLYIELACKNGCSASSLVIAFVDTSGMVIYYLVSKGLVPPRKPSNKEIMKMSQIPQYNEKKRKWRTVCR